jgi:trichohyalin
MHLIEIKKMPNGAIEEWLDGKYYKTIHDYADQKAAKALQDATEATALLKRQNERAEDDKRQKKADEEKAARAAEAVKEKEARDAESRKNRSYGDYSLLQDEGSRDPGDYSAVREKEARDAEYDKVAVKKWEEERDERARLVALVAKRAEDIERRDREKKEAADAYAERLRTETDEERKKRVREEDEQYWRIHDAGRF